MREPADAVLSMAVLVTAGLSRQKTVPNDFYVYNCCLNGLIKEAKEEVSLGKDSTIFSILFRWLKQGSMSVYTETKVNNTLYKEPDAEKPHVRICGG